MPLFRNKFWRILFRILIFVGVIEIGLRAGNVLFFYVQDQGNRITASRSKDTAVILCLGESFTALGGKESFPSQLEAILNGETGSPKYKVINKGIPSVKIDQILSQVTKYLSTVDPDLVVILIGANDPLQKEDSAGKAKLPGGSIFRHSKALNLFTHVAKDIFKMEARSSPPLPAENDKSLGTVSLNNEEYFLLSRKSTIMSTDHLNDSLVAVKLLEKKLESELYALKESGSIQDEGRIEHTKTRLQPLFHNLSSHYLKLGMYYSHGNYFAEGEASLKKAIRYNSSNVEAYMELAGVYQSQGKLKAALIGAPEAVTIEPQSPYGYLAMARLSAVQGMDPQAAEYYSRLLEMPVTEDWIFEEIGDWFAKHGHIAGAEKAYSSAIELSAVRVSIYEKLGQLYMKQLQYKRAESVYTKAIEKFAENARLHDLLSTLYLQTGKAELAKVYQAKARMIEIRRLTPEFVENYREIVRAIIRTGTKLIVMEYPNRPIEPLKSVLSGSPGVYFVENVENFRDALRTHEYFDVFSDSFAGDFGHCTPLGNRLIAEQLAMTIEQFL